LCAAEILEDELSEQAVETGSKVARKRNRSGHATSRDPNDVNVLYADAVHPPPALLLSTSPYLSVRVVWILNASKLAGNFHLWSGAREAGVCRYYINGSLGSHKATPRQACDVMAVAARTKAERTRAPAIANASCVR